MYSSGSLRMHAAGASTLISRLAGLYCIALLSTTVSCQGSIMNDALNQICLFDQHRTIVVGSTLFVDGGEWAGGLFFESSNNTARSVMRYQNEYLWKLDLTQSFTARTPPWEIEQKPSEKDQHYNGAEGTIWNVGMGTFATVGGWFSPRRASTGELFGSPYTDPDGNTELPAARIFTYNVTSGNWTSLPLGKDVQRISTASSTSSERKRKGYVLGGLFILEEWKGLVYPAISQTWLNSMTQYDFTTNEWKTEELPTEIGMTLDGGLIALDSVGEDGVLLFLGGQEKLDDQQPMRSMETIWVYDIATSEWYSQVTTGDIPDGRRQSCFFMVPAPDDSSFQIYLFSGALGSGLTLLDLYVLTVPGFIWEKVPITDYPDNYPINSHQCSPHAQGRQMLIVPGNMNASNTPEFQFLCNNRTGIKIFDTLDWKFADEFDPSVTEIGVPKPIINLIGGSTYGGAEVKAPKAGWQNKKLGTIFSKRNEPIDYNITSTSNTTSTISPGPSNTDSSPTDSASSDKKPLKLSSGAIAGIAIAVIAALLVGGGGFFCNCRGLARNRDDRKGRPVELNANMDPVEAAAVVPGELPTHDYYGAHQELGTGYLPPELMDRGDAKSQYPIKHDAKYGYMNSTGEVMVDAVTTSPSPVGYNNQHNPDAVYQDGTHSYYAPHPNSHPY